MASYQQYVPRLVLDSLHERPEALHRRLSGAPLFLDRSGFTSMFGRLARRGPIRTEELTGLLNLHIGRLLKCAHRLGGDSLSLVLTSEHAARRAAIEMR